VTLAGPQVMVPVAYRVLGEQLRFDPGVLAGLLPLSVLLPATRVRVRVGRKDDRRGSAGHGHRTPPPGGAAKRCASPPLAGSRQSASFSPRGFSAFASGSGRADVNNNDPSGVNVAPASPGAERVKRRAEESPCGSSW